MSNNNIASTETTTDDLGKPAAVVYYKVQYYDEDCECWEDDDTYPHATNRHDAESHMRALKRRYQSYVRLRVVQA